LRARLQRERVIVTTTVNTTKQRANVWPACHGKERTIRTVMGGVGEKPKKKIHARENDKKKIRAEKKVMKKNSCRRKVQL